MTPAQRIDQYLKKQGSPLAGYGSVFVREGRRNGFDPLLLVAIAGAESSFGKKLNGAHNPFGWGPGTDFGSFEDAISRVSAGLRKGYFAEGRKTIAAIGAKWAPAGAANDPTNLNANWAGNVSDFYRQLGGGGLAPAKSAAPMPAPVPAAVAPSPSAGMPDLTSLLLTNNGRLDRRTLPAFTQLAAAALGDPTASTPAAPPQDTAPSPAPAAAAGGGIDELLKSLGLTGAVTSGYRSPADNKRVGGSPTSFHLRNLARDVDPDDPNFSKLVAYVKTHPGEFREFFYDPLGWYVKNGRIVKGAIGGHGDHGHVVR